MKHDVFYRELVLQYNERLMKFWSLYYEIYSKVRIIDNSLMINNSIFKIIINIQIKNATKLQVCSVLRCTFCIQLTDLKSVRNKHFLPLKHDQMFLKVNVSCSSYSICKSLLLEGITIDMLIKDRTDGMSSNWIFFHYRGLSKGKCYLYSLNVSLV